ncbi:class I SAM-dependent methyltransferase [soil metagenome]
MADDPNKPVDLYQGDWLDLNRASWDEIVPVHVASDFYDLTALREGRAKLFRIDDAELPLVAPNGLDGLRVLHLQCHFGQDTLTLAQQGAEVVGIDFSKPAVDEARRLATEVGLENRSRFIHSNVYDARRMLPEPWSFDLVYTTWGTIGWLPDVGEWAKIISWFLKPGGRLYFADGHPAAFVFDSEGAELPYLARPYWNDGVAEVTDEQGDYAEPDVQVENTVAWEWTHPLSEVLTALLDAGLSIDFFHEHDEIPWRMHAQLVELGEGAYGWPAEKWLPLGYSLGATLAP